MAASDQTYRNQRALDVVFGASSVLMLASIVWMFAADYYREFKTDQREFRDVEEAVAQRQMLGEVNRLVPEKKRVDDATTALARARQAREDLNAKVRAETDRLAVDRVKAENKSQMLKADLDSKVSLRDIEVDRANAGVEGADVRATGLTKELEDLNKQYTDAQKDIERITRDIAQVKQKYVAEFKKDPSSRGKSPEELVAKAEKDLKDLTKDFERFAKLALQKRWGGGDTFRNMPIVDAFASPTKIHQYVLEELPIDYNFKYVTRFDRCATCHQGIDRANYDPVTLRSLNKAPTEAEQKRLDDAKQLLAEIRKAQGATDSDIDPDDLRVTPVAWSDKEAERRVKEFSHHPRLDLFVDDNSPHPASRFGCTICHSGQGSATEFVLASHAPNDAPTKKAWEHDVGWKSHHYWDYPMLPKRFLESACLKCHYNVTDLLPLGSRQEFREGRLVNSPGAKVTRGYDLVRENGCFGCHEISGTKGNRQVGPDLRLEPSPAPDEVSPIDRAKMFADPLNPPGTMRKLGPSLRRVSEKTNQEWTRRWLQAPREFRPDTRMPHFYGLSNNRPEDLPADQKDFPAAEIHAIAYYLFRESSDYLEGKDSSYKLNLARKEELERMAKDGTISEEQRKELVQVSIRLDWEGKSRKPALTKDKLLLSWDGTKVPLPVAAKEDKARQDQATRGRQFFTEKGCLACHVHTGTTQKAGNIPAVVSEADFGPNLSDLVAKIKPEVKDDEGGRRWLVQWILNPTMHFSRTRMPITYLTPDEAGAVATWLLSQQAGEWKTADPAAPSVETLERMARIYLEKAQGRQDTNEILEKDGLPEELASQLREYRRDADELRLARAKDEENWEDQLKWYIGKKAITQLGCYGCHDIPGFDGAKPIGTPLNDWGKKDAERLAFEDVFAYVKKTSHFVDQVGPDYKPENGKQPYETFFWEALEHHQRDGFLNQKLREPRSYDYARVRSWEDRLRMPQFKFAHRTKPAANEAPSAGETPAEAEAREAVMTFILGLVAEPIPIKFVNQPAGDKLAEVKGVKVLEKYNCGGCHQLRPGVYEFNQRRGGDLVKRLEESYRAARGSDAAKNDDFYPGINGFPDHNAWFGRPSLRPDRVVLNGYARPFESDPSLVNVRLTQATLFTKQKEDVADADDDTELKPAGYQIPAANTVRLPAQEVNPVSGQSASTPSELAFRTDPHGGAFTDLLVPYLVELKPNPNLDDEPKARSGLPPPLLREGEKVQPDWLFQFLRNPTPIRKVTILRMPRFNMSDEEAMALVNYFAAVDRRENPAVELSYPYEAIPQKNEAFLASKAQEYVARLGPEGVKQRLAMVGLPSNVWDRLLKERAAEIETDLKSAEQAVQAAKGDDKKVAEKRRDDLRAQLKKLTDETGKPDGSFHQDLRRKWEGETVYATDAFRLLTNPNVCLKCHQIGNLESSQPIGPALNLASDRLRPEWTTRWIASPQRMMVYPVGLHPMPQNFLPTKPNEYQELFKGTPIQQVEALRDILMNYQRVADIPENRYYRPPAEVPKQ